MHDYREVQTSAIKIRFSRFSILSFLCNYKFDFFNQSLNQKPQFLPAPTWVFSGDYLLWSKAQHLDIPKNPKHPIDIDLSPISPVLVVVSVLCLAKQVDPNQNQETGKGGINLENVLFDSCTELWILEKIRSSGIKSGFCRLTKSFLRTTAQTFSPRYRQKVPHSNICRRQTKKGIFHFDRWIEILQVRFSQKVLLLLIFLGIPIHLFP